MPLHGTRWMMQERAAALQAVEFRAEAAAGEVVVEVAGCGVCHTDLGYLYDGVPTRHALPLCLGHEISGRVVATGAGAESWSGRSVIIPAVIPCGQCAACSAGRSVLCAAQIMPGNDFHGGFASHVVVPARGLCPVPLERLGTRGLTLADVSVVADAVTTPYQALTQAGVQAGDLVIVNGVGGVGGFCTQIARALGATVVAIDVRAARLAALAGGCAALTLNAAQLEFRDLKAAIQSFARANGLPERSQWFIFECSGTRAGQETACNLLNRGATLGVVGFTSDKVNLRLSNLMAHHARALGNWGCAPELYPPTLELVLGGKVRLEGFVERHPLMEINRVIEAAHEGSLQRRAILVP
ncbi:MAG: 6-hydroxycyclohex-1-ene-1-carbonyl-CoA dehydrogenase [Gammaproteobacteria bacterium]|nr:6-hydroxycyclohex-1-ene-1-carbonyl-CoA dehydrogenase [Gammaproteobacteria bacterium]